MGKFIGGRVIPKHCGLWDTNTEYEPLCIVMDEKSGDSFISRKTVPAGTALSQTEYWGVSSRYSQQMQKLEDGMAQTKAAMNEAVEQMNTRLDANVSASTDTDADYAAEVVDARVDNKGNTHENLGTALRSVGIRLEETNAFIDRMINAPDAPDGTDFNSLTETGYWLFCSDRVYANTPTGDEAIVGFLEVRHYGNSWVHQVFYMFSSGDVYTRRGNEGSGEWNPWCLTRLVPTQEPTDSTTAVMSNHAMFLHNSAFVRKIKDEMLSEDGSLDLANVMEPGHYVLSDSLTLKDIPENISYTPTALIVERFSYTSLTGFVKQTLGTVTQGEAEWWARTCDVNGSWSAWYQISGYDIPTAYASTGANENGYMTQKAVTELSNAFPKNATKYAVLNEESEKYELTIGDIKEGGYYVLSDTWTLLDAPAGCPYTPTALIVENFRLGNGESFNRQTLSTVTAKPVTDYVRVSNNKGVWTDWVKVTTSGMEIVTTKSLPKGTDVDTVMESVSWLISDNSAIANAPEGYENRAAFFYCMKYINEWCLQIYIAFSGNAVFKRRGNRGDWGSWEQIGGEIVQTAQNNYSNTYEHTYLTQQYSVSAEPVISENKEYFLASTGNETDVSVSIAALLGSTGVCRLGPGDFYISGITLPEGGILRGCGAKTRLILLDSVSEGHAVKLGNYCTVKDLTILGSTASIGLSETVGTRHGIVFEGNADAEDGVTKVLPRTGIVENVRIDNFAGGGITCYNTGYSHVNSLTVSDCIITGCRAGINIAYWSEYHRFTNVLCSGCYYGCINNGGNNMFSNCTFTGNKLGFLMDNATGNQRNTAHGSVVCCTFNHTDGNEGTGIKIVNTANGYIFSGCQVFYSKIELKDAQGIVFDGFNFGRNEGISVEGGGLVLFSSCAFGTAPVVTVTENSHVKFTNCYTRAGTEITGA